jgi:hypothetical protein
VLRFIFGMMAKSWPNVQNSALILCLGKTKKSDWNIKVHIFLVYPGIF